MRCPVSRHIPLIGPAATLLVLALVAAGCASDGPAPIVTAPADGTHAALRFVDGAPVPEDISAGGETRTAFIQSSPSALLTEPLLLPREAVLEVGFAYHHRPRKAVDGEVLIGRPLDGVFSIAVLEGNEVRERHSRRFHSGSLTGWHDVSLDLSGLAGRRVRFRCRWEGAGAPVDLRDSAIRPAWSSTWLFHGRGSRAGGRRLFILISLDSLRADALGSQGYQRPTTPILDRFCRDAVQYADCVSPSPWTRPSHMSILTSLYPQTHGLDRSDNRLALDASFGTMAEILRTAGFWTMAITGGGYVYPSNGFERGFIRFHANPEDFAGQCARAIEWLQSRPRADLFLFLHSFTTHSPYNRHGDLVFNSAGVRDRSRSRPPRRPVPRMDLEARRLRRLYDDGVLYADLCLGKLFSELRRRGLYDGALIVVLSDHGELFLEHGVFGHSTLLYDRLLKVPLIIKYPGGPAGFPAPGTVVHRQARLIDVLPTVLEVLGVDTGVVKQFQGASLVPCVGERDGAAPDFRSDLLYAETYQSESDRGGVRTPRWSYLVDRGEGTEELYDLAADPGQSVDLIGTGAPPSAVLDHLRMAHGYLDALRVEGLHLSAGIPSASREPRSIRGRIVCPDGFRELNVHFPDRAGSAELTDGGRTIRFRFVRPVEGRAPPVPWDISFSTVTRHSPVEFSADGMVRRLVGPSTVTEATVVPAGDPGLLLPWGMQPGPQGPDAADTRAWLHLYRRPGAGAAETVEVSERQKRALAELGYIEDG